MYFLSKKIADDKNIDLTQPEYNSTLVKRYINLKICNMENLTYITGNYGKYISVREKFENAGITIEYFKCDLEEPDISDIEFISKEKARQVYEKLGSPVFVADSGFYIEHYPNNPG